MSTGVASIRARQLLLLCGRLTCESHTLMVVSLDAEYSSPSPPHRTQLTASVWLDMLNRHCSVTCAAHQATVGLTPQYVHPSHIHSCRICLLLPQIA